MVPKFRAYDTKNKVMVTNFHRSHMKIETGKVLYQLTTTNENEIKAIASYNTFDDITYRYSHDLKLMQSTCLKDKNGVEIFEGDVVICLGPDLEETFSTVAFAEGAFSVNHKHLGVEFEFLYFVDSAMEVIGNIYENPELLEPDYEN